MNGELEEIICVLVLNLRTGERCWTPWKDYANNPESGTVVIHERPQSYANLQVH